MMRKNKIAPVFLTVVALSTFAAAMDSQVQNQTQKNEIIATNDGGVFDPPKTNPSYLDKFKNWLGRFA